MCPLICHPVASLRTSSAHLYHLSLVRVPVCCRGSVPCVCSLGWDQGFMTSSSVPSPSVILILWLESWGFRVCALLSAPMIGPVSGNKPWVDQEMGLPHPLGTWVSLIRDEGSPYSDFWCGFLFLLPAFATTEMPKVLTDERKKQMGLQNLLFFIFLLP